MNIVDIVILGVLVFGLLAGIYKGFITSALSTVGFFGAWFGALAIGPSVANMALSNTSLMGTLSQYLEPASFFANAQQAAQTVTEVVSGGESAIQAAVSAVNQKISVIGSAFEANIRNQAFATLNISTLSDYLDQTIWQAVFNVLAFLLAFLILYAVISLVINLLDHVICFPVVRTFDGLLGGLFGLVRGLIVAILLLSLVPSIITLVSPEVVDQLIGGSSLYKFIMQLDFVGVSKTIARLIG